MKKFKWLFVFVVLIFQMPTCTQAQIETGVNFKILTNKPIDSRMVMDNLTIRDSLPSMFRYEGLTVYVRSDSTNYQLVGGITNDKWISRNPPPVNQSIRFSPSGGMQRLMNNNTGATIAAYTIVSTDTNSSVDNSIKVVGANLIPIGITSEIIPNADSGWVNISGTTSVLISSNVRRNQYAVVSTTSYGKARGSYSPTMLATIGSFTETKNYSNSSSTAKILISFK